MFFLHLESISVQSALPAVVQWRGSQAAAPELGESPSRMSAPCPGQPLGQRAHHPGWPVRALHGAVEEYWICWVRKIHWCMAVTSGLYHAARCLRAPSYLTSGSRLPSVKVLITGAPGSGHPGGAGVVSARRAAGPPGGDLTGTLGWTWGARLGLTWRRGPESPGWAASSGPQPAPPPCKPAQRGGMAALPTAPSPRPPSGKAHPSVILLQAPRRPALSLSVLSGDFTAPECWALALGYKDDG